MSLKKGENKRFDYTGSMQNIELLPGEYTFECYGASGAGSGGYGGYSKAYIKIKKKTIFYIGVGGKATSFNGGVATYYNHLGSGGGTHISYTNTQIKNTSTTNLLLVAGGGGGGCNNGSGGYGGGCTSSGGSNGGTGSGGYSNRQPGTGGTQSSGGYCLAGYHNSNGSYGQGGTNTGGTGSGGSMGGGGYYGGGPGGSDYSRYNDNDDGSGGGGSGYVNLSIMYNASGANGKNNGNGYVIITCIKTSHVITCINCSSNIESFEGNELVEVISLETKFFNGYLNGFIRYKISNNLLEISTINYISRLQFNFYAPVLPEDEEFEIIIEAIYDKVRTNSNYYRDSYYQEHFDFNKLIGGD